MRKFRSILILSVTFAIWQICSSFCWDSSITPTVGSGGKGVNTSLAFDSSGCPQVGYLDLTKKSSLKACEDALDKARKYHIAGVWHGGGQSTYVVEQKGNRVSWKGRGVYEGKTWYHTAEGTITGNKIEATWTDTNKECLLFK